MSASDALGSTGGLIIGDTQTLQLAGIYTHAKNLSMVNQTCKLQIEAQKGSNTTFTGIILLEGAVTKAGNGEVTFQSTSSLSKSKFSDITVNAGTLHVNDVESISGVITVNIGTLNVNKAASIAGSITLTSGVLNLTNIGDILSSISVDTGTLTLSNASSTSMGLLNISQTAGNIEIKDKSHIGTQSNVRLTNGSLLINACSTLGTTGTFTLTDAANLTMSNGSLLSVGDLVLSGTGNVALTNVTLSATAATLSFNLKNSDEMLKAITINSTKGDVNTLNAMHLNIGSNVTIENAKLSIQGKIDLKANLTLNNSRGESTMGDINLNTSTLTLNGAGNDDRLKVTGSLLATLIDSGIVSLTNTDFVGSMNLNKDTLNVNNSTIRSKEVILQDSSLTLAGINGFDLLSLSGTSSILLTGENNSASLAVAEIRAFGGMLTIGTGVTLTGSLLVEGNTAVSLSGTLTENLKIKEGSLSLHEGSSIGKTLFFSGSAGVNRSLIVTGESTVSTIDFESDGLIEIAPTKTLTVSSEIKGLTSKGERSDLTKTGVGTLILQGNGVLDNLLVTAGVFEMKSQSTQAISFTGDVTADGSPKIVGGGNEVSSSQPKIFLSNAIVQGSLNASGGSSITMTGGMFKGGLDSSGASTITLIGVRVDEGARGVLSVDQVSSLVIKEDSRILSIGDASISGTLTMDGSYLWARNSNIGLISEKGKAYISNSILEAVSLTIGHPDTQTNFLNTLFKISSKTEIRGSFRLYATANTKDLDYFDFGNLGAISIYHGGNVTFGEGYTENAEHSYNSTHDYRVAGKLTITDNGVAVINKFSMTGGTFAGDIFVEGKSNIASLINSTLKGDLTVEGGTVTLTGTTMNNLTVWGGTLTLSGNTTVQQKAVLDAAVKIAEGSILKAKETCITGSLLTIEGQLDSALVLDGGNAILDGEQAQITQLVTIKKGAFTYKNSISDSGEGNTITFTGNSSDERMLVVQKNLSIDDVNLVVGGTINLAANIIMRGALSGKGGLSVTGKGNATFSTASLSYQGDIHYDAEGAFYLNADDALGKSGTLYIAQTLGSTGQAHAYVQGTHSKNVVGTNVLLTTTGAVTWNGNISQQAVAKDGEFLLTVAANGSTIGDLTVTEGGFTSIGGNRFTNITAQTGIDKAAAVITLNQGDVISGALTTRNGSTVKLIGIATNLTQVTNAGTLSLSGNAVITVNETFNSSGTVLLENSSLHILQNVTVTGSIKAADSSILSSFRAKNLTIGSQGSLGLSNGNNTLQIDGDLSVLVQAGATSLSGVASVTGKSTFSGGTFTLNAVGDMQSYLGTATINESAKVVLQSDTSKTINASSIEIGGASAFTLNNVTLSLKLGVGSMILKGGANYVALRPTVSIVNSYLNGNLLVEGFNQIGITGVFELSRDLQVNTGGTLELSFSKAGIEKILVGGSSLVRGTLNLSSSVASHDFGSLGSLSVFEGGTVNISGSAVNAKALLQGNISLADNADNADNANILKFTNISFTGDISMAGSALNAFSMTDSVIKGDLILNGGTFNSMGDNTVGTASISGKTQIEINGGTLHAKTIGLIEEASILIQSTLDSSLSLAGKKTSATLATGGSITGDLTIGAGQFTYQGGSLGGKIVFNSIYGDGIMTVSSDWVMGNNNSIDMQSYGIITVAKDKTLTVNASITNNGILMMSGAGDFNFAAVSTHAGNLVFEGSGHLILSAKNSLGSGGVLSLNQADTAYMDVMADQVKSILSTSAALEMTVVKGDNSTVKWDGTIKVGAFTLKADAYKKADAYNNQSHFTLASRGSTIGHLTLEHSTFVSNGGNQFGNITLMKAGDMTLSIGDSISGITSSNASTIRLNGVVTTMQSLTNLGELYLNSKSVITVTGNAMLGGLTEFFNSSLDVGGATTIVTVVQANAQNGNSSLTTGSLLIHSKDAQLDMSYGISSVNVEGDFTMGIDSTLASAIRGDLSVAGKLLMNGGSLSLTIAGKEKSSLGTVAINKGTLSLISEGTLETVSALAVTLNSGGGLSLKNINLELNGGNGFLTINGSDTSIEQGNVTAGNSALLDVANSIITGHVLLTNNNIFNVTHDTKITGSLTVNEGRLALAGNGILSMKSLVLKDKGTSVLVSGKLNVSATTTLNGGTMTLVSTEENHAFGALGEVLLNNQSTLNITGASADKKAALAGNIVLDAQGGNNLAMTYTVFAGDVTLHKAVKGNIFTMTDSEILGRLTIKGGTFNVVGFNTVTEANIGGNTSMNIADGATFKAETTVVQPEGNLTITGTLDGALLLDGGNALLNGVGANITKNVNIISGKLTLQQGTTTPIGGKITFQGLAIDAAQIIVGAAWTMNQELVMKGFGSWLVNKDFSLAGTLSGSGRLDITGAGAVSLKASGSYTGDIHYNSTGTLTLGAAYALGTQGTLYLSTDAATLNVTGNQSKNLSGGTLIMDTLSKLAWSGKISLDGLLTLSGSGLTLGTNGSSIKALTIKSGDFVSMGTNTFGDVSLTGGSATFNKGDNLDDSIMSLVANTLVKLQGVTSTLDRVINVGTLALDNLSHISVSGNFESTGSLTLSGSSSLNVLGNMSVISTASLHNSTLTTSGTLTIQGAMTTAADNTTSTLNSSNIIIEDQGKIDMSHGVNAVTVSQNLTVNDGGSVMIRGSLSVQGISLLCGGTMSVTAMGNIISSLGTVKVDSGMLSLIGGDADHRAMKALSLTIGAGAKVSLDNVILTLNEGDGLLTLNEGTLSFSQKSTLDGHMLVNNSNELSLSDLMTVTGNVSVASGTLTVTGTDLASLAIGGSLSVATGASMDMLNLSLTLQAPSTIMGTLTLSTDTDNFDLGNLGQMSLDKGASFSATGATGHQATLAGTLQLSSTSSASLDQGSKATLTHILYNGSISVSEDYNTLTLTSSNISGDVTLNGNHNLFNMNDSRITGMLDIAGGTMNLVGANFASSASISGNAAVNIGDGASLTVETTVVKPLGELAISGTLVGALLLNGEDASARLNDAASITKNVTVTLGTLTNNSNHSHVIGGGLHFNGAKLGDAQVIVQRAWMFNQGMVMSGYGSLVLNAGMSLTSALSGTGRLDITGTGAFSLEATSSYTGDIYYSSTGLLTLGASNALGIRGTLHLSGDQVSLTVMGDQSKGLDGSNVTLTSTNNLTWSGKMDLASLTLVGANVTLAATQSRLNALTINSGDFTSMGSNSFGDVSALGGNASFNTGDSLTGNLTIGTAMSSSVAVTLKSVVSTLTSVTNHHLLKIDSYSKLTVSGDFVSTGSLSITGNSSLTVTGALTLADTELNNGTLSTDNKLTINGAVAVTSDNTGSHMTAFSLEMNVGGFLQMTGGLNSLHVKNTLVMTDGTAAINGSLIVGTSTTLNGGTLSLTLAGSESSALGAVVVNNGEFNLKGSDQAHRSISAGSMKITQGGTVSLNNVYLALDDSNGKLELNGGTLTFVSNSVLKGHMDVNGTGSASDTFDNTLEFTDSTEITGNVHVTSGKFFMGGDDGNLVSLVIGGDFAVATGAFASADRLKLDIKSNSTVAGKFELTIKNPQSTFNDFGNIGHMSITDGGIFDAAGSTSTTVNGFVGTLLSGNITLASSVTGATLILTNIYLNGDVSMDKGGVKNVFNMSHVHINGNLVVQSGTLNFTGANYAEQAYINTKDAKLVDKGGSLKVKTAIVMEDGHLDIGGEGAENSSTLDGILWLSDGGTATLNNGGIITGDVNIESGIFTYNGGSLLGNVVMEGDTEGLASIVLDKDCTSIHSLNMKDYGTIELNVHNLSITGGTAAGEAALSGVGLAGSAELIVNGTEAGSLTISATGTHTGDIAFNASTLILNANNALGTKGTLNMTTAATIQVSADQYKAISGGTVTMEATKALTWWGVVNLKEWIVNGELNLGATGSSIVSLTANGTFTTKENGSNKFGSITTGQAGASITLNQNNTISGSITSVKDSTITLNGVTANIKGVANDGHLILQNSAAISVEGDIAGSGKITLNNSGLSATCTMNVHDVSMGKGNTGSSLVSSNMNIKEALNMSGGSNTIKVEKNLNVTGDAKIDGTVRVGGELNVSGELELALGGTQNSELGTATVKDDGALTINGGDNKKTAQADSIRVESGGKLVIDDATVNVNTGLVLAGADKDDIAEATIKNSTIQGDVSTIGDFTNLTLDTATITGNLNVNGGILNIEGVNKVGGTATISKEATVNVAKDATLESGVISLAPDGSLNVEDGGSIGDSSLSFGGGNGQQAVSFEGDHTLKGSITMDANGAINVNGGTLTLSGELKGSAGDLTLITGADSKIMIDRDNTAFSGDVVLDGDLVLAANNALGSSGSLSVKDSSTVTVDNKRHGLGRITIGKDITGDTLNLVTNNETILSGDLSELDKLIKTGSKDLTLSGGGSLDSFDLETGTATINGSKVSYTMDVVKVAKDTTLTISGESALHGEEEGSLLTSSGSTIVKNATLDMNVDLVDGGSLSLGYHSILSGDVNLKNGSVNFIGSDITLDKDAKIVFAAGAEEETEPSRMVNVEQNVEFAGHLIIKADGLLTFDYGKILTLSGCLSGNATLKIEGHNGSLILKEANADFTGTLSLGNRVKLVGESSGAFGGKTSSIKIDGERSQIVTGIADSLDLVSFDNTIQSNDKDFELKTLNDTTWNGALTGTGTMTKTGDASLIFQNQGVAGQNTMTINVQEGSLSLGATIAGNIVMGGGTRLSTSGGHGTKGDLEVGFSYGVGKEAIIDIGGQKGLVSSMGMNNLELGSNGLYIVDAYLSGDDKKSDCLNATGDALISGATIEFRTDYLTLGDELNLATGSRWTILSAAGEVNGKFNANVDHNLSYHTIGIEYVDGKVDLVLYLNYKGENAMHIDGNILTNQAFISNVLTHISYNNAGGVMGEILDNLEDVYGKEEIKKAVESIGGVCLTTLMQSQIARANNHMRIMNTAMENDQWKTVMSPHTAAWIQATGDKSEIKGDGNGAGYKRNATGGTMGVEHLLQPINALVGMAFSYDSETWTSMENKNKNNTGFMDFFIKKDKAKWHHYGLFGVSQTELDTSRTVAFGSYHNKSEAGTNAYSVYANYELAYDATVTNNSALQVLGEVQMGYNTIDGYTEQGSIGNAGLNVESQNATTMELGAGVRYNRSFSSFFKDAPQASYGLKAMLTYDAGALSADTNAAFISDPSTRFTMKPAKEQRYGALFGANISMPYSNKTSFYAGGTYEFKSDASNATGNIGVMYTF